MRHGSQDLLEAQGALWCEFAVRGVGRDNADERSAAMAQGRVGVLNIKSK